MTVAHGLTVTVSLPRGDPVAIAARVAVSVPVAVSVASAIAAGNSARTRTAASTRATTAACTTAPALGQRGTRGHEHDGEGEHEDPIG
jgi:hypothetical protein